jgi:hypothetical protein
MTLLPISIALPKLSDPCYPDPHRKWIPTSLIPITLINLNVFSMDSSPFQSSPNLLEKMVAN